MGPFCFMALSSSTRRDGSKICRQFDYLEVINIQPSKLGIGLDGMEQFEELLCCFLGKAPGCHAYFVSNIMAVRLKLNCPLQRNNIFQEFLGVCCRLVTDCLRNLYTMLGGDRDAQGAS